MVCAAHQSGDETAEDAENDHSQHDERLRLGLSYIKMHRLNAELLGYPERGPRRQETRKYRHLVQGADVYEHDYEDGRRERRTENG